ncbi:MAG: DUF5615 family PIN-like protein [Fimbriimonadaceae bacterium]
MKILFDNNVPLYLLSTFPGASTAYREGWHELSNGRLLETAESAGFTLLITLDRGFQTQQTISGRSISVAILKPPEQSRDSFLRVAEVLLAGLDKLGSGMVLSFE